MISKFITQKSLRIYSRFLVRHVYAVALAGILITAISLVFALKLSVDSDYMAFLPADFPGVKNLKKVITKTGGFGNFMIVLKGSTPEERIRYAEAMAGLLEELDWVDYAEYKKGWEKIEKNKLLYVSLEDLQMIRDRLKNSITQKKGKKNPFVVSLLDKEEEATFNFDDIERKYLGTSFGTSHYEDPKRKNTIVIIWPKGSMTNMQFAVRANKDLQKIITQLAHSPKGIVPFSPQLEVGIGGEFRNKIDEYNALKGNIMTSIVFVLIVISLILFLFYRKRGALFYTLIPLIMGSIWSCGLAYLVVGRLNLLTVFLVAILLGLGMDYGVYFFSSYLKLRRDHATLEETITAVLEETGRSTFSAALTSALSFLTLVFMDFKGFNEFGLLSFIGILCIYVAFIVYSPVIWILAEKWKLIKINTLVMPTLGLTKFPLSRKLVIGGFVLAIVGVGLLPFVQFEYDYGKLRKKQGAYSQFRSSIHKVFPLSKTPAVVITDTLDEAREVVEEVKRKMPTSKTIDTVKSLLDFLPEKLGEKKDVLSEIRKLLVKNRKWMNEKEQKKADKYLPYLMPAEINISDLPKSLLRQFMGLEGSPGYLVFIYDKVRLSDARNAILYAEEIGEIKTANKTYYPAEGSLLFAKALSLMIGEAAIAYLAILIGVYLVLFMDFRSWSESAVVFLPLLLGLATTFGVMAIFGVKINIFNLVIFPILIGLGVDSSLHIYHQFKHRRQNESFSHVFIHSGVSLLLTSLLNMVGFGSMLFTQHQGLNSMGLVSMIGMGSNLVICLFFFPSFLKWREERKK